MKGRIVTGRTHPIEGNRPLTEVNRSYFKPLVCCLASFFFFFLQVSFAKYSTTVVR